MVLDETAMGTAPVNSCYLTWHLLPGIHLDQVRGAASCGKPLAVGRDLMRSVTGFNLSPTAAINYAAIAGNLLASPLLGA